MATREQLLGFRRDLTDLHAALKVLTRNRLEVAEVEREIQRLTELTVPVDVPCVLCRTVNQVPTRVDDPNGGVPRACLCESCDQLTAAAPLPTGTGSQAASK